MEKTPEKIAEELSKPETLDYRGRNTNVNGDGQLDVTFYADIDRLLNHPVVCEALRIFEGGLAAAQFEVLDASSSQVGTWAQKALERFWENDLHHVQRSYRYGWQGAEILFREEGDSLAQVGLKVFHPNDTRPVKFGQDYAGFRVRNLIDQGDKILRSAGRWPGRAFWHGHEVAYGRFYGESQLRSSHRDWQRLAEQRGAEEILDLAITRTGVPGPKYRYPEKSIIERNTDGTLNYEPARQRARKTIEDWLAGMAWLGTSETDDKGKYLWDIEWPTTVLNANPLIDVIKHYESRICYGIGTPRELMESVDTGGWAGRNITMETFLATQQRIGRQILTSWFNQIGLPLAKFHHGPDAHFTMKMIPLNKSRMDPQQAGQPGANPLEQPGRPVGNSPQPTPSRFNLPPRPQPRMMSTETTPSRRIKTSPLALSTAWEESKHPRADDGKFGQGHGSSKDQESKKATKVKPLELRKQAYSEAKEIAREVAATAFQADATFDKSTMDIYAHSYLGMLERLAKAAGVTVTHKPNEAFEIEVTTEKPTYGDKDAMLAAAHQYNQNVKEHLADFLHDLQASRINGEPLDIQPYVEAMTIEAATAASKAGFDVRGKYQITSDGPTLLQTTWDESKHPRADDGKFGQGAGSSSSTATKEQSENTFMTGKSAKRYKPKPEGWGEMIIPGIQPEAIWNIGTSGGYKRAKPLIDEVRRLYADPEKVTSDDVKSLAEKILHTTGRDALYTLAKATGVKTGTSKAIAERVLNPIAGGQLDLPEVDQTKEVALQRQIRKAGGTAKEAKQVTEYARKLRDDTNKQIDYQNDAIRYAYQMLSKSTGKPFTNNHQAFDDGDYTQIAGFDEVLISVNSHYPGVIGHDSGGYRTGEADSSSDADKLWELLGEGLQPRKTINDTFPQVYDEWERNRGASNTETPF